MNEYNIRIVCPFSSTNKIAVIKAIRCLTGMGLKEAKDISDNHSPQDIKIEPNMFSGRSDLRQAIEEQIGILRLHGVGVQDSMYNILQDLRDLASQALKIGDDELANEILQLVTAEKLRRKP